MDDSTRIWAARRDGQLWLRIAGRAMADYCPTLRAFCESHLSAQRPDLYVALPCCEHFDSTFLGTLLCLKKYCHNAGAGELTVVAPGEECLAGLRTMGAHHLFPITDDAPPEELEWELLCGEEADRSSVAFQQQVVDAHCELAEVPGELGKLYQPIAKAAAFEFRTRQASASR